jgi:hypothetical protein
MSILHRLSNHHHHHSERPRQSASTHALPPCLRHSHHHRSSGHLADPRAASLDRAEYERRGASEARDATNLPPRTGTIPPVSSASIASNSTALIDVEEEFRLSGDRPSMFSGDRYRVLGTRGRSSATAAPAATPTADVPGSPATGDSNLSSVDTGGAVQREPGQYRSFYSRFLRDRISERSQFFTTEAASSLPSAASTTAAVSGGNTSDDDDSWDEIQVPPRRHRPSSEFQAAETAGSPGRAGAPASSLRDIRARHTRPHSQRDLRR